MHKMKRLVAKKPWIKPQVRRIRAGSAESGGALFNDGSGNES